jgi:molybdenum cofactor guanylyltransferase
MQASGFVLAGGESTRMGRDKALLPFRGTTLVQHVARVVAEAAGNVALIGDPARYGHLGYAVFADKVPGCGPLSGIYTALSVSPTDWNVLVACDMPALSAVILRKMVHFGIKSTRECIAATGPSGQPEPLCALYHRRSLPAIVRAMDNGKFRMREMVGQLDWEAWPVPASALANANTPDEWAKLEADVR